MTEEEAGMEGSSRRCMACGSEVAGGLTACPSCGQLLREAGSDVESRAGGSGGTRRWLTRVALLLVLASGFWVFYRQAFRTYAPVIAGQPDVQAPAPPSGKIESTMIEARRSGGSIVIPLHEVVARRIVRFYDPGRALDIPLLAYVTPSGRLVTAISISENCRSDDFYLEGEDIHCAHCPSYWNASSLEAYACCQRYYPDPVPSIVAGDEIRIDADVVRRWKPRS
jgi:hypothetical protein